MKNSQKTVKNSEKIVIFEAKAIKITNFEDYKGVFQLCPLGTYINQVTGQPVSVTRETVAELVANFNAEPQNEVVFDYEHQTLYGGAAPASGWIKALVDLGDRGLGCRTDWTANAELYLKNKEYKYRSPVIKFNHYDERGKYLGAYLHSAALTNKPYIRDMPALVAKLNLNLEDGGKEMDKELLALLGLPETADSAQIIAAVKKLKSDGESAFAAKAEIMKRLNASDDAGLITALDGALKHEGFVAKSMYDQVAAERDTLKTEIAKVQDSAVETLVAKALTDGKITPAQKAWANDYAKKDRAGFEAFVASAAKVIPTDKIDNGAQVGGKIELNAEETAVCKQLGLDAETYRKYNPVK